jgi:hypothetical protein
MPEEHVQVTTRIAPAGADWVDSMANRKVSRARILVEALKFASEHKDEFEARIKKLREW